MENEKGEQKSQVDAKEQDLAVPENLSEKQESENILEEIQKLKKYIDKLREDLDEEKNKRNETVEKLEAEAKAKSDALNELEKLKIASRRVFCYEKDFDNKGVIYAMGSSFGKTKWANPSSTSDLSMTVTATRSSDKVGSANNLLDNIHDPVVESGTKSDNEAWWCVALSEEYSLHLTHYTLRHGLNAGHSFLRNWQLEGSLDGSYWEVLKIHENDLKLGQPPPYIATWKIDRKVEAFRYFKIVQKGKNSTNTYNLYLSGIELYGELIKRSGV